MFIFRRRSDEDINIIRSKNHDIYSMRVNKLALSANDDKRLICKK